MSKGDRARAEHKDAMYLLGMVQVQLSALNNALRMTGNEQLATKLENLADNVDHARNQAERCFTEVQEEFHGLLNESSGQMLKAAFHIAEMKDKQ